MNCGIKDAVASGQISEVRYQSYCKIYNELKQRRKIMVEVSASVLNVDNEKAIKTLYELETAKVDYFHIDVMDGKFVKTTQQRKC